MPIVETVTDPTRRGRRGHCRGHLPRLSPHSRPQDIEAFIAANLTATQFEAYIAHSDSEVFVVRSAPDGPIIGYSLVHHRPPADPVSPPSSQSRRRRSPRSTSHPIITHTGPVWQRPRPAR